MNRLTSITFAALSLVPWSLSADALDEARRAELAGETASWKKYFTASEDDSLSSLTRNRARDRAILLINAARNRGDVDDRTWSDYARKYKFAEKANSRMDIGDLSVAVKAEEEILNVIPSNKFSELSKVLKAYELSLLDRPAIKKDIVGRLTAKLATQNDLVRSRLLYTILFLGGPDVAEEIGRDVNLIRKIDLGSANMGELSETTQESFLESFLVNHGKSEPVLMNACIDFCNIDYNQLFRRWFKKNSDVTLQWIDALWSSNAKNGNLREGDTAAYYLEESDDPVQVDRILPIFENRILPALLKLKGTPSELASANESSYFLYIYWNHYVTWKHGDDFNSLRKELRRFDPVIRCHVMRRRNYILDNSQLNTLLTDLIRDMDTSAFKENVGRQSFGSALKQQCLGWTHGERKVGGKFSFETEIWIRIPGIRPVQSQEFYDLVKEHDQFDITNCQFNIYFDYTEECRNWIETCSALLSDNKITPDRLTLDFGEADLRKLTDLPDREIISRLGALSALIESPMFEDSCLKTRYGQNMIRYAFDENRLRAHMAEPTRSFVKVGMESRFPDDPNVRRVITSVMLTQLMSDGRDRNVDGKNLVAFLETQMIGDLRGQLAGSRNWSYMHHRRLMLFKDFIPIGAQLQIAGSVRSELDDGDSARFFEYMKEKIRDLYAADVNHANQNIRYEQGSIQSAFSNYKGFSQAQLADLISDATLPLVIRRTAINKLSRDIDEKSRDILIKVLKNRGEDKNVVLGLLGWIQNTGDFEFTPTVAEFLDSRDAQLRAKALEALEEIKRIKELKSKWLDWYDSTKRRDDD